MNLREIACTFLDRKHCRSLCQSTIVQGSFTAFLTVFTFWMKMHFLMTWDLGRRRGDAYTSLLRSGKACHSVCQEPNWAWISLKIRSSKDSLATVCSAWYGMYVYDKHLSSGSWECKEYIDNLKNWLVYHNSRKLKSKKHAAINFNILDDLFLLACTFSSLQWMHCAFYFRMNEEKMCHFVI